MPTNISSTEQPAERISYLLAQIGQPARIQILLIISQQEACVCHLEATLGLRQASISQHLMVLRRAGLVVPEREGRNIFYRLAHPAVVEILQQAARFIGVDQAALQALSARPVPGCPCPQCNPGTNPEISCSSMRRR